MRIYKNILVYLMVFSLMVPMISYAAEEDFTGSWSGEYKLEEVYFDNIYAYLESQGDHITYEGYEDEYVGSVSLKVSDNDDGTYKISFKSDFFKMPISSSKISGSSIRMEFDEGLYGFETDYLVTAVADASLIDSDTIKGSFTTYLLDGKIESYGTWTVTKKSSPLDFFTGDKGNDDTDDKDASESSEADALPDITDSSILDTDIVNPDINDIGDLTPSTPIDILKSNTQSVSTSLPIANTIVSTKEIFEDLDRHQMSRPIEERKGIPDEVVYHGVKSFVSTATGYTFGAVASIIQGTYNLTEATLVNIGRGAKSLYKKASYALESDSARDGRKQDYIEERIEFSKEFHRLNGNTDTPRAKKLLVETEKRAAVSFEEQEAQAQKDNEFKLYTKHIVTPDDFRAYSHGIKKATGKTFDHFFNDPTKTVMQKLRAFLKPEPFEIKSPSAVCGVRG